MVVDKPNVQSMVFKAEEGSFLVGVIAATTSKTGKVGFVGGMDIPLISAFECGYAQGVKHVNDKNAVHRQHDRHDAVGLERPGQGRRTRQGADLAGRRHRLRRRRRDGQGVLKAAADAGKFGIGVDSDQDNLFPGKILTSMLKRVDVATYEFFKAAKDGTWKAGIQVFGLKNNGVGYAEDQWNKPILTRRRQEGGGGRQGRHHLRQDRRARLHVRQQVPGVRRASRGVMAGLVPAIHVGSGTYLRVPRVIATVRVADVDAGTSPA